MKVKNELKRLFIIEGACGVIFIILYFIWMKQFDTPFSLIIFYPLLCCSFILVQGSVYWYICLKQIDYKIGPSKNIKKIYRILRVLNFICILFYPFVLFINDASPRGLLIGLGIYIFCILEYINYFYIRLSYPVIEFFEHILKRNFSKSRIARMLK